MVEEEEPGGPWFEEGRPGVELPPLLLLLLFVGPMLTWSEGLEGGGGLPSISSPLMWSIWKDEEGGGGDYKKRRIAIKKNHL